MENKVLAFVTRSDQKELLVHEHVNFPEAGVQVPAGTVEKDEDVKDALFREIYEESGLEDIELRSYLGKYIYKPEHVEETHERNVYHLISDTMRDE